MDPNDPNQGDENVIEVQGLENQKDIAGQISTDFRKDNISVDSQNIPQELQMSDNSCNPQPNNVSMFITPTPTTSSNLSFEPEGNEHLDNVPGEPYYHLEGDKQEDQSKVTNTDANPIESNVVAEENSQTSDGHAGQVTIGTEQQYVKSDMSEGTTMSEEYAQREDENFESQYESENNKEDTNGHGAVSGESSGIKVEDSSVEPIDDFPERIIVTETVNIQPPEISIIDPIEECVVTGEESSDEFPGEKSDNLQVKQEVTVKSKDSDLDPEDPLAEQTHQNQPEVSTEIVDLQHDMQTDTGLGIEHPLETVTDEILEITTEEIEEEQVIDEDHNMPELHQEPTDAAPTKAARRGRRPIHDVPMHLLGHDIAKPVDSVPNGRAMPKPRLGVKVPYRNLASQIISKEELEKEIIERSRAKEEAVGLMGDVKFARGLTQRLANKIAPASERGSKRLKKVPETTAVSQSTESSTEPPQQTERNKQPDQVEGQGKAAPAVTPDEKTAQVDKPVNDDEIIQNDDDLLAILEGEGDEMPVLAKEVENTESEDIGNLKMLEREIALQQLQELPHLEPKPRIFKSRQAKSATSQPPQSSPSNRLEKITVSTPKNPSSVSKTPTAAPRTPSMISKIATAVPKTVDSTSKTVQKPISVHPSSRTPEKQASKPKLYHSPSPVKPPMETIDMSPTPKKVYEIEPQVKVNMVLKTYSRKRKPSDSAEFETAYPKRMSMEESELIFEKPDPLALPTDVYVTKSSRIIKKKVIWDPDDEFPARKTMTKSNESKNATPKTVKATEKSVNGEKILDRKAIEKGTSSEKQLDKKIASEKKATAEKSVEKRISMQEKKVEMKPVEKKITPKRLPLDKTKVLVQKVSPPKSSKTPNKSKRGLSEVDRLLMDEGAVKMLYELNNSEESSPALKRKKDYISIEKAEKDLIKKANQLKNDLVHNTSGESAAKTLRKKEGPSSVSPSSRPAFPMERKMSKDSTMSSIHTPPRSPTFPGSMLIRRRSSSSTSSGCGDDDDPPSKRRLDSHRGKRSKRGDETREGTPEEEEEQEDEASTTAESPQKIGRSGQYKSFTVKRTGKHVSIDVHYIDERCFLDTKVLEELTSVLKKYGKDKECAVVSLVSSSTAFCLGLDYATLVSDDDVTKTCRATDLATKVRDFLLCLLNFPKVLVAGIQGECVGLGVTMLPLFDMVIASDTATFSTPYSSLGCQGEAAFFLNYPNFTNNGLTAELLYAGTTLTADEAVRRGLISKLCWPEKYKDTLKSILSSISQGSNQSLEATKKQLRGKLFREAEAAIKAETNVLIEQWMSPECQESFLKL